MENGGAGGFEIRRFLNEGWALFKSSASSFIVMTIVYFVVYIAANMIPIVNLFAGFLLPGAMFGGMYLVILDANRGVEFDIKRMFDGFKLNFINLTLVYVLTSIFIMLAFTVTAFAAGLVLALAKAPIGSLSDLENISAIAPLLVAALIPGMILAILVSAWYMFAYLFVVDRGMGFWEAMEASRRIGFENHGKVFLFVIALGLINVAGILFFIIGLLVTFPFMFCATAAAYLNMSGAAAPARRTGMVPPPPPPPPAEEDYVMEGPALDAGAILTPERKAGYVHVFVFIEGAAPSGKDMDNIIRAGAPAALEQDARPVITGHGVDFWPLDDSDLKALIKEAITAWRGGRPDAPNYLDSSLYKIKVWKGRDSATRTNMALASVLAK